MFERSIDQYLTQKQVASVIDYNRYNGVVFYNDGTIRCPMCETRHENNSMCQNHGGF